MIRGQRLGAGLRLEMVSLAHGYLGCLPTPRHFELGGYETWRGTNFLEPQASVTMLEALIEMAAEIAPPPGEDG